MENTTIDKIELIKKMLEMQKELDKEIFESHGLTYADISQKQYNQAILDEVGEFNHELKANWCWWKFTQEPVNKKKALEELVDIWHLVLSYTLKQFIDKQKGDFSNFELNLRSLYKYCFNEELRGYSSDNIGPYELCNIMYFNGRAYKLAYLWRLSEILGYSVADIYVAYIKKNETNHERVEQGY